MIYNDLDGKPIPLDYLRNDKGEIVRTDDCTHLKYCGDKFHPHKVKIVGRGWSDYAEDDGTAYREYMHVIVHYFEESDLMEVIKATEKLLTETSFVKNIDSIIEIQTLN